MMKEHENIGDEYTEDIRDDFFEEDTKRVFSAEHRLKLSLARQRNPKGYYFGKKHTEESKQKMSESHLINNWKYWGQKVNKIKILST